MWPGKLVVKGVQNVEDCRTLADLGVDGIVLSNHGGRQLDRAPVPFYLLPEVVKAVGGRTEIAIDTGIMNGADIVASIALGARFTLVGRAYLYGLMAGGRAGVDRAIEILRDQVIRTMKLLEVASVAELNPGHVTQLRRLAPRQGKRVLPVVGRTRSESLRTRALRTGADLLFTGPGHILLSLAQLDAFAPLWGPPCATRRSFGPVPACTRPAGCGRLGPDDAEGTCLCQRSRLRSQRRSRWSAR